MHFYFKFCEKYDEKIYDSPYRYEYSSYMDQKHLNMMPY